MVIVNVVKFIIALIKLTTICMITVVNLMIKGIILTTICCHCGQFDVVIAVVNEIL